MSTTALPAHTEALLKHFADLRDGKHAHAVSRPDKEKLFTRTVELIDPYARTALSEINTHLLLGSGTVAGGTPSRSADGGLAATWSLSWWEQEDSGIAPVLLRAFYGAGFHHPHLQGGTVGEWPLNVFTAEQAAAELPTLRAIATADLHNLVFQRDYRIIPATVSGRPA